MKVRWYGLYHLQTYKAQHAFVHENKGLKGMVKVEVASINELTKEAATDG